MTYQPVTDREWHWLERRFVALERTPGIRELFNNSLPESPYSAQERRSFRREIMRAIKDRAAPTEAYPNPYFELTWIRNVEKNPELLEDVGRNRAILWNAFFQPSEPPGQKEANIEAWRAIAGEITELVTITDRELEVSE